MKLNEMAKYAKHRTRYLYSGGSKFMQKAEEIFRKYDPDVEIVVPSMDVVEVEMEFIDREEAKALGAELEKFDEWWADEFGYNPYGGFIQL